VTRDSLYGRRWRKARAMFLSENPWCAMCDEEGRKEPATEVDHIKKHNGNPFVFWDETNWQGLCAYHHRTVKAQMERSGRVKGNGVDGTPLDPQHHWKN